MENAVTLQAVTRDAVDSACEELLLPFLQEDMTIASCTFIAGHTYLQIEYGRLNLRDGKAVPTTWDAAIKTLILMYNVYGTNSSHVSFRETQRQSTTIDMHLKSRNVVVFYESVPHAEGFTVLMSLSPAGLPIMHNEIDRLALL